MGRKGTQLSLNNNKKLKSNKNKIKVCIAESNAGSLFGNMILKENGTKNNIGTIEIFDW